MAPRLGSLADTPNTQTRRPSTTPAGAPKKAIGNTGQGALAPWGNMQDLVDLFEETPALRWPTSVYTYSRMRTDAQLGSLWQGTTLPIRRYRWAIKPNGARDEVVEAVASDLNLPIDGVDDEDPTEEVIVKRAKNRFRHDDHMRQALLALIYGHMFFEQVGNVDDTSLDWRLETAQPLMPYTLAQVSIAQNGELEYLRQYANGGPSGIGYGGLTPPIPGTQLIPYVWEREGANWLGRSMFRPCYRHWLRKDRLLRIDAIKHERNGMGIPVGKASPGMTPKEMATLQAMTQAWKVGEDASGALPPGADIELKGVTGSVPDAIASIRYDDEQMAKMFLAMVNELGQTAHGSRALGETMQDAFILGQESIASWYANVTTEDVIWDIVDWNFGQEENAPQLVFHPNQDRFLAVEELYRLTESGVLTIDDDTEQWLRSFYNLPPRNIEQPGRESTRIVPIPGGDTSQPSTGTTDVSVGVEEGGVQVAPEPVKATGRKIRALRRAPQNPGRGWLRRFRGSAVDTNAGTAQTANYPTVVGHRAPTTMEAASATDFANMQRTWETQTQALVNAYKGAQADAVAALLDQIETAAEDDDLDALASITTDPVGADIIAAYLVDMAQQAMSAVRQEAASQGVTLPLVNADAIRDQLTSRAGAVANVLGRSLATALSNKALNLNGPNVSGADVKTGVRSYFNGLGDTYLTDMLGGALTQGQNAGRFHAMSQAGSDTPVKYYSSEILDIRTCIPCNDVDGTEYASIEEAQSDYPTGGYGDCAGGPRCRGTIVAVYGEATTGLD